MTVLGFLRSLVTRISWVAIAVLIALGCAGLVTSLNPPPVGGLRHELTWTGDTATEPALDAATEELRTLAEQVDALSETARAALGQLAGGDAEAVEATVTEGTLLLGEVRRTADSLAQSLDEAPNTGDDWAVSVSDHVRRRYLQLAGTARLTEGLEEDWASFTGRSLAASRLGSLLQRHDEETAAAARDGAAGRYREALEGLAASDATLALARELRDDLAPTTDVVVLTSWLDRNADYDEALRNLYEALIRSDGEVTNTVRRAFDREQAARSQLPADTRALIVITSDIAEGGLNDAVIAIEEARGALAEALEVQEQLRDGEEVEPELPG